MILPLFRVLKLSNGFKNDKTTIIIRREITTNDIISKRIIEIRLMFAMSLESINQIYKAYVHIFKQKYAVIVITKLNGFKVNITYKK